MKSNQFSRWSSALLALLLSTMIAPAQDATDSEKPNKQLQELQDRFERQQRELRESFEKQQRELSASSSSHKIATARWAGWI